MAALARRASASFACACSYRPAVAALGGERQPGGSSARVAPVMKSWSKAAAAACSAAAGLCSPVHRPAPAAKHVAWEAWGTSPSQFPAAAEPEVRGVAEAAAAARTLDRSPAAVEIGGGATPIAAALRPRARHSSTQPETAHRSPTRYGPLSGSKPRGHSHRDSAPDGGCRPLFGTSNDGGEARRRRPARRADQREDEEGEKVTVRIVQPSVYSKAGWSGVSLRRSPVAPPGPNSTPARPPVGCWHSMMVHHSVGLAPRL